VEQLRQQVAQLEAALAAATVRAEVAAALPTGAAVLVLGASRSCRRPRQLSRSVRPQVHDGCWTGQPRRYKGRTLQVEVLVHGFAFEGK
jgi:hypothetical protein